MQKLLVFSMCTQDGNCVYVTPSTVGGKTVHRRETSELCLEKLQFVRDSCAADFVCVVEISCF
jgi:hypothetical protein